MAINSDSNLKITHQNPQLNSSLPLENLEDLQDLRQAKQEQTDEAIYSLEEVKQAIIQRIASQSGTLNKGKKLIKPLIYCPTGMSQPLY
ncbi:hypothetical protein H6G45_03500 [Synechocystis sp. FACHB-383]|uniref:hypothetical protein n=1 Tax=Synechocystis sp. FACHB-383 TaxID=2692864 RepID=UPI001683D729|nr:hypothetical protein [Synechocystis sp. FACHB-383]MBD2652576.1 hypothetical protein [Synechocystis sp. FACHB-383]